MIIRPNIPRAFVPLLETNCRYKGAKGGRGGAKSHWFAEFLVADCTRQHLRTACLREVQKSIKDSVKQTLEDKIDKFGIRHLFKITDREIVYPPTESLFVFRGLQNHTATSIKSLEGFNRALYEEAQALSKRSIELATPTFRTLGTQQLFAWNPENPTDPVEELFRDNDGDPDFKCIEVNYSDNPWFPEDLRRDMLRDKARNPEKYNHVWLGGYRTNSEARVFRNWRVDVFDPPSGVKFYLGADWGFANDPTVLIVCYIVGRTLYIWREVRQVGCQIDRTPALFDRIDPEWTVEKARDPKWKSLARKLPIIADSARPETIAYMQRAGFNILPAIKGPGSIEDGVEFLQSYDIIIHQKNCPFTKDDFSLHSFIIDKKTNRITGEMEDANNDHIDAARYALENIRRGGFSHEELRI